MGAFVQAFVKWWRGKEGKPWPSQLPRLMDVNSRMVMSADPLGGRDSLLMRMRSLSIFYLDSEGAGQVTVCVGWNVARKISCCYSTRKSICQK
jgi:hypothetical protein